MAQDKTKDKIINGLFWKVMESGGAQGIQFVISLILARLLSPDEYGVINLVLIFITIANVMVQNGFGTALIQKYKTDEKDFSSVFYVNLLCALGIYLVLFALAPFLAAFYRNPEITRIVRVWAVILFPGGVICVQNAYVARKLKFKALCLATMLSALVSGICGIVLAAWGYGVWALVGQQLAYYFVLMAALFAAVSWRPRAVFDFARIKTLFQFGWKLLSASVIDTVFMNLYGLVVGKVYNDTVMGIYTRGEQFPKLIVTNLGTAIQSVMLPALSAHQNQPERIGAMLRRSIKISVFLVLPMMAGMAAAADNLVLTLLGEKWMASVPFLQISCLAYAVWPMDIANLQALNAMGRSDVFLKLEVVKKFIGVVILVLTVRFGAVSFIAWKAVGDFLCTFINAWPNQKLLGYSIARLWKDVLPALGISGIMGILVYLAGRFVPAGLIGLTLQILLGAAIYFILCAAFRLESLTYLADIIKNKVQGHGE